MKDLVKVCDLPAVYFSLGAHHLFAVHLLGGGGGEGLFWEGASRRKLERRVA